MIQRNLDGDTYEDSAPLRLGPGGDFERNTLIVEPPEKPRPEPELVPRGQALVGHLICLVCGFATGALVALAVMARFTAT